MLLLFQAKKAKQAEIDRKRAEVRKRLEETAKAKKAKKGFMTPERKKKLRVSESHVTVITFATAVSIRKGYLLNCKQNDNVNYITNGPSKLTQNFTY
jgi:hypothetical protein